MKSILLMNNHFITAKNKQLGKMKLTLSKLIRDFYSRDYEVIIWKIIKAISGESINYGRFYFVRCNNFTSKVRKLPDTVILTEKPFSYEELRKLSRDVEINWKTVQFQIGQDDGSASIIELQKNSKCIGIAIVKKTNILKSRSGYFFDLGSDNFGAWIFNVYLAPECRMKGYFINLIEKVWKVSKKYGNNGIYGEIHFRNMDSLRAHKRLGFEIIKNMRYIKIFNKTYYIEKYLKKID